MLADILAVREDLRAVGELLAGHEVELFEQRYVTVGFVVALDPRVAVPVPDTAEVATHLDDVDILDAGLLQRGTRQQAGESAAEHRDIDIDIDAVAFDVGRMRVDLTEFRVALTGLQVLLGTFCTQSLLALHAILLPQRRDVDITRCRGRAAIALQHAAFLSRRLGDRHASASAGSAASCNGAAISCTAGSTSRAKSFTLSMASAYGMVPNCGTMVTSENEHAS